MKKLFLLSMLFASICMSAQTLEGDVNKDGKLTIEDVTKVIDLYLNYEEPSEPEPGTHEYVDLGLSVKWATCNVGANSPEEYGDYFAWGETTPKSIYNWSTYKWRKGSSDIMTKYCTESSYGTVDNRTVLDPEDDAAHVNWGGDWRMPTKAELDELRGKCTWSWTTVNGVKGRKVVGANGNSIFLPAAGFRLDSSLYNAYGQYWSSSLDTLYSYGARYFGFSSSSVNWYDGGLDRYRGQSVRPVCQ